MCRGIGLDVCEIARMEKMAEDSRFLERYFTAEETGYIRSKGKNAGQTMAGIFAAKEAVTKALGTGIAFDLKEISILHDEAGMPFCSLSGRAKELGGKDNFFLSISHDGGIAAAACFREGQ